MSDPFGGGPMNNDPFGNDPTDPRYFGQTPDLGTPDNTSSSSFWGGDTSSPNPFGTGDPYSNQEEPWNLPTSNNQSPYGSAGPSVGSSGSSDGVPLWVWCIILVGCVVFIAYITITG